MVVQVLSTAVIHVRTNVADLLQVRTVIDSGSGASFVSEGCVQKLGLPRSNGKVVVFRVENKRLDVTTRGLVKLEIINQFNETTVLQASAYVVGKLTSTLPTQHGRVQSSLLDKDVQGSLANPAYQRAGSIDIILGSACFFEARASHGQ